jgi:RNA polymerase sigma-70 factor (ECF subfamily)
MAKPLDEHTAHRLRSEAAAFFARRCHDRTLVDDLTQQCLTQLLRGLPHLRRPAALRPWLQRIAANVWNDHLRAARGERNRALSVMAALEELGAPPPSYSPEQAYRTRATHDCLRAAIDQLPAEMRGVLALCEYADLPLTEAAARLGCSPTAAKVRLHRARRRLADVCRAQCVSDVASDGTCLCEPQQGERLMKRYGAGRHDDRTRRA